MKLDIRANGHFEWCGGKYAYVEIINGTTEKKLCETEKIYEFNSDMILRWNKERKNLGDCKDIGPIFL